MENQNNPLPINQPITTNQFTQNQSSSKKATRILAGLAVTSLFVGGLTAGLLLINRNQDIRNKAADVSTYSSTRVEATCDAVVFYDTGWNELTSQQITQMSAGDIVRLAIKGTTNSGSFDQASFTVNGEDIGTSTSIRPETGEFYTDYTIPENVVDFEVGAHMHHTELDQWI